MSKTNLQIFQGGTGASTAAAALTALGAYPASNPAGYTTSAGLLTAVTATGPVVSSGGTAPVISMPKATTVVPGYLDSVDFITFNNKQAALGFTPINSALIGAANGICPLDSGALISSTYLPSYVDDVVEYANLAAFPGTGVSGKIFVALDTNKTYRWSGSAYVYITSGAVDSVAGRGGVVVLVKGDVGLGNVDNTSDANKPVSTAQATANTAVQTAAATDATTKANSAQAAAIAASAPLAHVGSGGTAHANVTTTVAGFMTAADKVKLDGIASGATATNGTVTSVTGSGAISVATGTTTPVVSIVAATTVVPGTMSAADKTKLDAITGTNTGDQINITGNAATVTSITSAQVTTALGFTPSGTGNFVNNETLGGVVDGTNATFTLANTPVGLFLLFVNGMLQEAGAGNDFTISGTTITMLSVPTTGAKVRAFYMK